MTLNDSNLNDRSDDSSLCPRVEEESSGGGLFGKLLVAGICGVVVFLFGSAFWSVYRSIDPMEQRELFFQNEIVYIHTQNVLFWIMVSFACPVMLGVLYLLVCGGFKRGHRGRRVEVSTGSWEKPIFLRLLFAIPAGGLVVWLVSRLDFRWADRQAGGWAGIQDLGTLFLGALIGPTALVAVLFLVVLLCIARSGGCDEPTVLKNGSVEEFTSGEPEPGETSGSNKNAEEKDS